MSYNNYQLERISFPQKVVRKLGKWLAKSGLSNSIRVWGLNCCGFSVGEKVYVGEDLIIISPLSERTCHLIIGNRVAIAPRVTIILGSDPNYSQLAMHYKPIRSTVTIEDDCWIGTGVIIQPNIRIEKGSIIGAGSVVTKNVAAYSIVAGVPARVIGSSISPPDISL